MMRALILLAALASPAHALEAAREAAVQLQTAAQRLQQAQGAEDRISALTQAVEAYDGGLAALRDGLRQLSVREAALSADLAAREDRVSRLIGVLTGIERTPRPLLLLHPEGPMGTARAAMLLGDAAPALEAEARALRTDLETLTTLRSLEEDAAGSLEDGLNAIQSAREALSIAISDRAALPARFANDGEGLADLRTRATTLASFAEGMADLPGAPAMTDAVLPLPLPARATLLRRYRQPDAAGITRPGMILSLSPQALVSAPTRATVRYAGPLLDYGLVIILEPRPDALIVLAGLDQAYVRQGDILASGAALGLMGETAPSVAENATSGAADGGALLSKTLYVEVREMGVPVDPAQWFDLDGSDPSTSE